MVQLARGRDIFAVIVAVAGQDKNERESDPEDAGTVDGAIVAVVFVVAIVTTIAIAAAPRVVCGYWTCLANRLVLSSAKGNVDTGVGFGRGTRAAHWITTREREILEADGFMANSKRQMRSYTRRVYMSGTIELLYRGWKEISARTQPTLTDYADHVYTLGDDGGGLRGRHQRGMP